MGAEALAIGTGIQAFTSIQSGQMKKQAYEMEAQGKMAQAAQVDIAANRDIELTMRRFQRVQGAQISGFGRSGVQLTGSPLLQLEATAADAQDEMKAIRDAANYRKSTLLTEGQFSNILGQQAEDAGYWGAAGSVLTGVARNPYSYDNRVKGNL